MLQSVVISQPVMYNHRKHTGTTNLGYSSVREFFNYGLIVLFAFAFSLQQFAAFAYTQHADRSDKQSSYLRVQHHVNSPQFTSFYTPEINPLECVLEFVEEDEEAGNKKNSTEADQHSFLKADFPVELCFELSQKSRYTHLTKLFKRQPSIPLFVLHHSWKTHLS